MCNQNLLYLWKILVITFCIYIEANCALLSKSRFPFFGRYGSMDLRLSIGFKSFAGQLRSNGRPTFSTVYHVN